MRKTLFLFLIICCLVCSSCSLLFNLDMPQLVGKTINDVIERNGLEIKKITQEKDKIEYTVTHYVEVEKKAYLEQKCDSKGNHCIYEINPPTTAQMLCGYDIITDKNNIILSASKRVIASNCNLK